MQDKGVRSDVHSMQRIHMSVDDELALDREPRLLAQQRAQSIEGLLAPGNQQHLQPDVQRLVHGCPCRSLSRRFNTVARLRCAECPGSPGAASQKIPTW